MDKRYILAKKRLSSFSIKELERIINHIDIICLDTYNFNESDNTFCPIAIAMGINELQINHTDDIVKSLIGERFDPINIFKGTEGYFYTTNRKEDLLSLCEEIIEERK